MVYMKIEELEMDLSIALNPSQIWQELLFFLKSFSNMAARQYLNCASPQGAVHR